MKRDHPTGHEHDDDKGFTEKQRAWYRDGRCPHCGAIMECGDEFIDERICDDCVKRNR